MLTTRTSLEILGDQRCILRIINLLKTIKERKNRTRNFHPIFPPSQIIVFPLSHRGWPRPKGPLGIRDFPTCLSRFSSVAFILPEATLYLSRVAVHVHKRTNTRVKRTNTWTEAWRWLSRLDAFRAGGCCARGWNVGREVEMHLSGRGTPPSGLYLAERKKPKNLYHLGSKGKEDGEGFLIQGTVTFSLRIPLREKPLRFWSPSDQRVFIRSMYRCIDFSISRFRSRKRKDSSRSWKLRFYLSTFVWKLLCREEKWLDMLISSILKWETVYNQDVDT